ncbi:MAG: transglycosylase domain-containing protein, partial [Victivallaceae bacterium]
DLPEFIPQFTAAVEDCRFDRHAGVDYVALARALKQFICHGRLISGGSTISMQLSNMATPAQKKNLWYKFRQICRAKQIEHQLSKAQIMELYLNFLPYGGNIYGIEAASQYYFGRAAKDLNKSEYTLLVGIPQRPNRLRPDKNFDAARKRQKTVLEMLVNQQQLTAAEAEEIYLRTPIRLRNFNAIPWPNRPELQYLWLAQQQNPLKNELHTALQLPLQKALENILQNGVNLFPDINDAAGVVIRNRTSEVIALVGTLDFSAEPAGQVNAATALRQAGSTLKPFIYAQAVNRGLLTENTLILDAPLQYKDYQPGNFDKKFYGMVSCANALNSSLNTPAIRLLEEVGTDELLQFLQKIKLISTDSKITSERYGLSLALGSIDVSLLNLTNAYAGLARGGKFVSYSFLKQDALPPPTFSPWHEGVATIIRRMMSAKPLPQNGTMLLIAWKTGTSNGNHDAWCIAYDSDYTVGIWVGNKDNTASKNLVGGLAAAPLAGNMFQHLYRFRRQNNDNILTKDISLTKLCSKSGLKSAANCREIIQGFEADGVNLRNCRSCFPTPESSQLNIISPKNGTEYFAPAKKESIEINFSATINQYGGNEKKFLLFVDNEYLGEVSNNSLLTFKRGSHTLMAMTEDVAPVKINFTVK